MARFSKTYKNLNARFDIDNFEVVMATLSDYYSDFINLDALEFECKKEGGTQSSYMKFAAWLIGQLKGLYTKAEVIEKIEGVMTSSEAKSLLLTNITFVPSIRQKLSPQIGLLEKFFTGKARSGEPLSRLDMMRFVNGVNYEDEFRGQRLPARVMVTNLANLSYMDELGSGSLGLLKRSNNAFLINVNADFPPKWVVVNLVNKDQPEVYCEMLLTTDEKRILESRLDLEDVAYSGGTADSLASTGYGALAWLDQNILKVWNFNIYADFPSLLSDVMILMFGGDHPKAMPYSLVARELREYATESVRHILQISHGTTLADDGEIFLNLGHILYPSIVIAESGECQGKFFKPGDVVTALEQIHSISSTDDILALRHKAWCTLIPGFNRTLLDVGVIHCEANKSTLIVPQLEERSRLFYISPKGPSSRSLQHTHQKCCEETNTNHVWLSELSATKYHSGRAENNNCAAMMVLAFIRAQSKKRALEISFPHDYFLTKSEQKIIISSLSNNAYVTNLGINEHVDLKEIKKALIPALARNRWLADCGYRPPLVDDYWKKAAMHWIVQLNERPDMLTLKEAHKLFKACIYDMGVEGLTHVLECLSDESQREFVARVYDNSRPAFYAACPPEQYESYLGNLFQHLKKGAYFPFSELCVSFQPGNDDTLLVLMNELNELKQFDKLTLSDFLIDGKSEERRDFRTCKAFLESFIEKVESKKWTRVIVIPELESNTFIAEDDRRLRRLYTLLNDYILRNRHEEAAKNELSHFQKISDFVAPDDLEEPPLLGGGAAFDGSAHQPPEQPGLEVPNPILHSVAPGTTWPLTTGGVVQLQMQQQQQIEQNRQVYQEQQRVVENLIEEAFSEELITYENIDRLLTAFYEKYKLENPIQVEAARLKTEDESLLQGFFHTWVSAKPGVNAKHIIRKISPDAAKILLKNHTRLTAGLNSDNLPKGFFTQRAKDGELVLCYNPGFSYVILPNALTLKFGVERPEAQAWQGDFRLFNLDAYKSQVEIDDSAFKHILLFAMMQPPKKVTLKEFNGFLAENYPGDGFLSTSPGIRERLKAGKGKILANWEVFIQVWQFSGDEGVEKFLNTEEKHFNLSLEEAIRLLLKALPEKTQTWVLAQGFTENELRGLGQVYYRYGVHGLQLLLNKFQQIQQALGREFFDIFHSNMLQSVDNYNCFMSERNLNALDAMMKKLKPTQAKGARLVFQNLMGCHIQSVGWEYLDRLWNGYAYFLKELEQLGLSLGGSEFDGIASENVLVLLDRVLSSLKHIPNCALQQTFLSNLSAMDLQQGGVHYALKHEHFKFFNEELQLTEFVDGAPAYAPDEANLYSWGDTAVLKRNRSLACQSKFNEEDYKFLKESLNAFDTNDRHKLVLLIHCKYNTSPMTDVLEMLDTMPKESLAVIAHHLHEAIYTHENHELDISLQGLIKLSSKYLREQTRLTDLFKKFPNANVLECASILDNTRGFEEGFDTFLCLLENIEWDDRYPSFLYSSALKLASLFRVEDIKKLNEFYTNTLFLRPIVRHELALIMRQIMSVDYQASEFYTEGLHLCFDNVLAAIDRMRRDPANTSKHRIQLVNEISKAGLVLRYSKSGDYRALLEDKEDKPKLLTFFVDHKERLWRFLQGHIAVSASKNAQESLAPIMRFLKQLQLNRTYLNEIEPLLSTLETTPHGQYWSAEYFSGLLKALQPDTDQASFPISLLKVILKEGFLGAKPIDDIQPDFPASLVKPLQQILGNTVYTREQQAQLCQLILKEYQWEGRVVLTQQIMNSLSLDTNAIGRGYTLDMLVQASHFSDLKARFENCEWFLQHKGHEAFQKDWVQTASIWLRTLTTDEKVVNPLYALLLKITPPNKQALLAHIIAYSTLRPGLRDAECFRQEFVHKSAKLLKRLSFMKEADLLALAHCYPAEPSPGTDDVLRMLKASKKAGSTLNDEIECFLRTPHPEARPDFGRLTAIREADFRRMIVEAEVSGEDGRKGLSAKQVARLTLIFGYLKALEDGEKFVLEYDRPISQMNQAELQEAFQVLSRQPDNDVLKAQIWAVLFEVLGRTTRKYPHLAQQFALIANETAIDSDSPSSVLQLKTGEGKSHFVAMRAARQVGAGKVVDICTAKRSLAKRDLNDYKDFFDYLGISSSYIHPKSSHEAYEKAQVHYTTIGDLSLFLDEQSYSGNPIETKKGDRVALFDEFDFIHFEEGRQTEYNYARPTGNTPKQMTWFYQAINSFYQGIEKELEKSKTIDLDCLASLIKHLGEQAGDIEERHLLFKQVASEPIQLVQWIRAAREAHKLEWGVSFTVREVNIEIGDESYPMREIIPLSSDNQVMTGSTYSGGVHQLLAVRLNNEERKIGGSQNYHIHPESRIVSSQIMAHRMETLWGHWEGFSGTISSTQSKTLSRMYGTEVLHVPTNQRDLRVWHKPKFYEKSDERLDAVVKQIQECIKNKQSMLFSCKNDKRVKELMLELEGRLTAEETSHFIFYTNEEHQTAADVLASKKELEGWHGGQKQKAIGLVASGFGRGDNVGVEAVFLFDVKDDNDRLQKGGRTARNGTEGEVFQFYIQKDVRQERDTLMRALLSGGCDFTPAPDDDGNCFEQVMLLREYLFSLQNIASQGYRFAIAEFSGWGMQLLGQIEDPTIRHSLTDSFSRQLKELAKQWADISGDLRKEVTIQIQEVRQLINKASNDFIESYNKLLSIQHAALNINELIALPVIEIGQPNQLRYKTARDGAMQAISGAILHLKGFLNKESMALIPEKLNAISEKESALLAFAEKAVLAKTLDEFERHLSLAHANATRPSIEYDRLLNEAELADDGGFYEGVRSEIVVACQAALSELFSELKDPAISYMRRASELGLKVETRISKMLPLLKFLAKFPETLQNEWGAEYIEKASELLLHHDASYLGELFEQIGPTEFCYFEAIYNLASIMPVADKSFKDIAQLMQDAIQGSKEQRLRMITKWELWAKEMQPKERAQFFNVFCTTMKHFKEGETWDVFVRLMDQTRCWWHRDRNKAYQPEILLLWQQLSKLDEEETIKVCNYLSSALRPSGKSWYKFISQTLEALSPDAIGQYGTFMYSLGERLLNDTSLKKAEAVHVYGELCKGMANIHKVFNPSPQAVKAAVHREIMKLELDEAIHLLEFAKRYKESLRLEGIAVYGKVLYKASHALDKNALAKAERDDAYENCCFALSIIQKRLDSSRQDIREELLGKIATLKEDRLLYLFQFAKNNEEALIKYPDLLPLMLSFIQNDELNLKRLDQLQDLCLRALRYQEKCNPHASLHHLFGGIAYFAEKDELVLKWLERLFDEEVTAAPLFDKAAEYLAELGRESVLDDESKLLDVFKRFYQARASMEDDADIAEILQHDLLQDDFAFLVNEPETHHKSRVMLMHLLNNEVLVSRKNSFDDFNDQPYVFAKNMNDTLLKTGFKKYLEQTKRVLDETPAEKVRGQARDLSFKQHCELLQVGHDFEVIGSLTYHSVQDKKQTMRQVEQMREGVLKQLDKYDSAWFLSKTRQEQSKSLRAELHGNLHFSRGKTGYEAVLNALHEARKTAWEADRKENKSRFLYKLHTNGHSRYYETLNKMQDMILRHWAMDEQAMLTLPQYQVMAQKQFDDIVEEFKTSLIIYIDETFTSNSNNYRTIYSQFQRTFSHKDYKAKLNELRQSIDELISRKDDDHRCLANLRQVLEETHSRLPGHLQALSNELLSRADLTHYYENDLLN